MSRRISYRNGLAALALLLVVSAGCVRYQPKPISGTETAAHWQSRSLANAGLRAFVETNLGQRIGSWPLENWDFRLLTLAAFYYHPDLDVARAKWSVAQAGVVTASGRPNPSVGVGASYIPSSVADAWILQPSPDIPIETFGKRGYRIQQVSAGGQNQPVKGGSKPASV